MTFSLRLQESKKILALAWPIAIAQIAEHGMGFTDTLMSSWASQEDLAAIALGSSIWMPLMFTLCGILMAVTPLVASNVGAGKPEHSSEVVNQGFWIAITLGLIATVLLNNTGVLLQHFDVPATLADKTQRYLSAISFGFPAIMLYQVGRSLSEGFGFTRAIMHIAIIALLFNIPLNYTFIFGIEGMIPAMGGVGCGVASAMVMWLMLFISYPLLWNSRLLAVVKRNCRIKAPSAQFIWRLLRLGVPIGISLLIESSMFSVISLLLAASGNDVIAAHQITLSMTALMFMIPLSISIALTIRVGHNIGANNARGAKFSAATGLMLTITIATCNAALLLLANKQLAQIYTHDLTTITLACQLLSIAGLFQIADSIQVTSAGALRGYEDTATPLAFVFIAYWVIGLPSGYWMATAFEMGAAGYWFGLVAGLSCGAMMLGSRLYWISHEIIPETTTDSDATAKRV